MNLGGRDGFLNPTGGFVEVSVNSELSALSKLCNCSLFNNVPSDFLVGHYHSWVISDNKLPKCLEITSLNNENLIMSFKHKRFDVKGIQFHPESILTDFGLQILKNWIDF